MTSPPSTVYEIALLRGTRAAKIHSFDVSRTRTAILQKAVFEAVENGFFDREIPPRRTHFDRVLFRWQRRHDHISVLSMLQDFVEDNHSVILPPPKGEARCESPNLVERKPSDIPLLIDSSYEARNESPEGQQCAVRNAAPSFGRPVNWWQSLKRLLHRQTGSQF